MNADPTLDVGERGFVECLIVEPDHQFRFLSGSKSHSLSHGALAGT